MQEGPTMPIRRGQSNLGETIHHQLKLCSEFHLKRVLPIFSEAASHLQQINSSSGPSTAHSILGPRTNSSICSFTMTSHMTISNCWTCAGHLELLAQLPTQHTTHARWWTCGQKREEAIALGITTTELALSGWLRTWICTLIITWQTTHSGLEGMELFISLPCGPLTVSAWWITVTNRGHPSKFKIPSSQNRRDCFIK